MHDLSQCALLVVDDVSANIDVLVEMLADLYELGVALDGHSAVEYAREHKPDCILMDVQMPGMDGIEATRRIKALPGLEATPIIMVTSSDDEETLAAAFGAGVADYIHKPLRKLELLARVNAVLRLKMEQDRRLAREREVSAILDAMLTLVFYLDPAGRLVRVNEAVRRELGRSDEALLGKHMEELFPKHTAQAMADLSRRAAANGGLLREERQLAFTEGRERWYAMDQTPQRDASGEYAGVIIFAHDITARKQAEEQLRELATTDPLTKVWNRRHFLELADQARRRAERFDTPTTLLMLDADNFKHVNDTHGHEVGDTVLKRLAEITIQSVRDVDIVGRLGGEEFVVLLPETNLEAACAVAERIRARVADCVFEATPAQPQRTLRVTVSIGVSCLPGLTHDCHGVRLQSSMDPSQRRGEGASRQHERFALIEEMLRAADEALYRAKKVGRNCVVVATP